MKYYHKHLLVAIGLSIVLLSPTAGVIFYLSREIRDRQKIGRWDVQGLWWPLMPLAPFAVFEWALKLDWILR